jgi:hypothetical protein
MLSWAVRRLVCIVIGHEWRIYETDCIPPLWIRLCLRCDWLKEYIHDRPTPTRRRSGAGRGRWRFW